VQILVVVVIIQLKILKIEEECGSVTTLFVYWLTGPKH